ncbi:MAG: acylphosphatase [Candidatus Binatia bacterium]|nr:acylphosphatase [Candidatus Binatia bacterium]
MRLRLAIRGRVQGVWFRGSAREEALRLGLVGWARNRGDGSVEIVAEGTPSAMNSFLEWCHHGPPGAHVHDVTQNAEPSGDDLVDFRVRY